MPRRGTELSPEAAERNAAAISTWHKENSEVIKFSIRVPKGCAGSYRELARRRGQSLTGIIREYLNEECRKEGIEI